MTDSPNEARPAGADAAPRPVGSAFKVQSIDGFFGGAQKSIALGGSNQARPVGRPWNPNSKAGKARAPQAAQCTRANDEKVYGSEVDDGFEPTKQWQQQHPEAEELAARIEIAQPKRSRATANCALRKFFEQLPERIDPKGTIVRQVKCLACSYARGKEDVIADNLNSVKRHNGLVRDRKEADGSDAYDPDCAHNAAERQYVDRVLRIDTGKPHSASLSMPPAFHLATIVLTC
jgi:hypothetical protein